MLNSGHRNAPERFSGEPMPCLVFNAEVGLRAVVGDPRALETQTLVQTAVFRSTFLQFSTEDGIQKWVSLMRQAPVADASV